MQDYDAADCKTNLQLVGNNLTNLINNCKFNTCFQIISFSKNICQGDHKLYGY